MVEFAIVLPLLLVLVFGISDFGRAVNYRIDATHIAHSGARWAAVNNNPGGGSLQAYLEGQADTNELKNGSSSVPSKLDVCITFPEGATIGKRVRVEAKFTYRWLEILGLDSTQTTISVFSSMRLEATPTNYTAGCA